MRRLEEKETLEYGNEVGSNEFGKSLRELEGNQDAPLEEKGEDEDGLAPEQPEVDSFNLTTKEEYALYVLRVVLPGHFLLTHLEIPERMGTRVGRQNRDPKTISSRED